MGGSNNPNPVPGQQYQPFPGQPATPRMLRSLSTSLKTLNPEFANEMQTSNSHTRTPSSHRVPPGENQIPARHAEKELLPPASLNSDQHRSNPSRPPAGQDTRKHPTPSQKNPPQPQQPHQQQQQQQFHRKCIGDWDFISTIGAGSMGKVKLARHNYTNEKCAVKIVPRAAKLYQRAHANDPPLKSTEEAIQRQKEFEKEVARDKRTIREGALGRLLFHPHICRLYEMVPMTNHYYMLFEYVEGGQLLDYIVSHGSLNEKYARKFARGIALALDYCHKNNVVHRDLKIENIMINQKGEIKIIDFGLSNLYVPHGLLKTYCGSLYFAAPELLSAKPYIGPEVDIWSLGVVLYVLVCGKVPFDDPHVSVLHEKIKKGNVQYPSFISKECVSLLSRMLVVDPTKRASLQEVILHPWMNKGFDFIVPNYMPKRVPLTLPLDPEIIQAISSFDLGSVSAIAEELTSILNSAEYQQSYETWHKCAKQGRPFHPSFPGQLDPTCGFHPLVSIYHLVDEMRKRRKAKEEALKLMIKQHANEDANAQKSNQNQLPPLPSIAQTPATNDNAEVRQTDTLREKENPFLTPTPKESSPPASKPQQLPELKFPEEAHTQPTPGSIKRNSESPSETTENIMQQPAPGSRNSTTPVPETLDPNAGMPLGFNSLFRRLSSKRTKNTSASPTRVGSQSTRENATALESSPSPKKSQSPALPGSQHLSPQQSVGSKADPLVRRGVSMKVTAKEKSSSNVNSDNILKSQSPKLADVPNYKTHGRSSSSSANKFHGFIPVEYLPPLPNITASQMAGGSSTEKPNDNNLKVTPVAKKFHPTARAKSVGGHARKDTSYYRGGNHPMPQLPNTMAAQNSDEIINSDQKSDAAFDDVTLDLIDHHRLPRLTEEQIIEQFNKARRNSMPSIEYPKTLFLKGFFSVQTTSTKPLPVIRYNIINVLTKLGVRFQEVKGGFICVHAPSLTTKEESEDEEGPDAITIIDEYKLDENEEEKQLYGDAFNPSSESMKGKEVPERSTTPEPQQNDVPQIVTPRNLTKQVSRQPSLKINSNVVSPLTTPKTHRSSNSMSGHRRKISIGQSFLSSYRKKNGSQTLMPPNTPAAARVSKLLMNAAEADSDDLDDSSRGQLQHSSGGDSIDSLNGLMIGGGSDMLVSSRIEHGARHQRSRSTSLDHETAGTDMRATSKTPLKFEINIVKVPLVGLYGVQFKKTLGNTWNYKTLASQILNELNL